MYSELTTVIVFLVLNYVFCKYGAPLVFTDSNKMPGLKAYCDNVVASPIDTSVVLGLVLLVSTYLNNTFELGDKLKGKVMSSSHYVGKNNLGFINGVANL
jgi:hypothetical protein